MSKDNLIQIMIKNKIKIIWFERLDVSLLVRWTYPGGVIGPALPHSAGFLLHTHTWSTPWNLRNYTTNTLWWPPTPHWCWFIVSTAVVTDLCFQPLPPCQPCWGVRRRNGHTSSHCCTSGSQHWTPWPLQHWIARELLHSDNPLLHQTGRTNISYPHTKTHPW